MRILRFGGAGLGRREGERERFSSPRGLRTPSGLGSWQTSDDAADFVAPRPIGGCSCCRDGQPEAYLRTAGDTDFLAHEPVGLSCQLGGFAGLEIGRRVQDHRQQQFALVALANDVAAFVFQQNRRGPLDRPGGPAGGERPLERRRQTRAGI